MLINEYSNKVKDAKRRKRQEARGKKIFGARRGAVDVASAPGAEDPGSNPARV
jgi:hypothetical protein